MSEQLAEGQNPKEQRIAELEAEVDRLQKRVVELEANSGRLRSYVGMAVGAAMSESGKPHRQEPRPSNPGLDFRDQIPSGSEF